MRALRTIKRFVVALMGGTVLLAGLALIVLPGPAFLLIPAGLAILAIEFAWAKRWLCRARALLPKNGPDGSTSVDRRAVLPENK